MASWPMRRIGLLGGMSWESTALYYRLVNEEVRDRLGGFHSARLVLASVDFAEIEAMQVAGDWAAAGALLADEARRSRRPAPSAWCCAPTRCTRSPTRSRPRSASRCCTWPT